jgi:hypothetical protein
LPEFEARCFGRCSTAFASIVRVVRPPDSADIGSARLPEGIRTVEARQNRPSEHFPLEMQHGRAGQVRVLPGPRSSGLRKSRFCHARTRLGSRSQVCQAHARQGWTSQGSARLAPSGLDKSGLPGSHSSVLYKSWICKGRVRGCQARTRLGCTFQGCQARTWLLRGLQGSHAVLVGVGDVSGLNREERC